MATPKSGLMLAGLFVAGLAGGAVGTVVLFPPSAADLVVGGLARAFDAKLAEERAIWETERDTQLAVIETTRLATEAERAVLDARVAAADTAVAALSETQQAVIDTGVEIPAAVPSSVENQLWTLKAVLKIVGLAIGIGMLFCALLLLLRESSGPALLILLALPALAAAQEPVRTDPAYVVHLEAQVEALTAHVVAQDTALTAQQAALDEWGVYAVARDAEIRAERTLRRQALARIDELEGSIFGVSIGPMAGCLTMSGGGDGWHCGAGAGIIAGFTW